MSANVVFYKMHGILLYSARGMLQWHENMLPEFSELILYNARARAPPLFPQHIPFLPFLFDPHRKIHLLYVLCCERKHVDLPSYLEINIKYSVVLIHVGAYFEGWFFRCVWQQ